MKRSDIVPLIVIGVLLFLAFFKLLPLTYLLLLTFLMLMCGVLIYCYPVKGSLWTSASLLILFGLFSMYQLHYFAFRNDVGAALYIEPLTVVWITVVGWMVFSSVELLHWAFNVWDKIGDHHKPVAH